MHTRIPNILTVIRLIAAPMVGFVYVIMASPYADWIALSLFIGAALTDYLDGVLARRWNVVTQFGRMMDPIADKAMVVIALAVVGVLWNGFIWVMVPIIMILFREVFVAGLREFLGSDAGRLQVTRLAKFKTAIQMLAITLLMATKLVEHYFIAAVYGMDQTVYLQIKAGEVPDTAGLIWLEPLWVYGAWGAQIALWIAAVLTVLSGLDYFIKALPYLKDRAP